MRRRVYLQLFTESSDRRGLSLTNKFIVSLILFSVFWLVIETEITFYRQAKSLFDVVDLVVAIVFTLEYAARIWAAGEDTRYQGLAGRVRYALSIWALVDLAAILPYYIALGANEAFVLRVVRLFRVLAIGKIGRYSNALKDFMTAIRQKRYDFFVALGISLSIMVTAATGMYLIEGRAQPDAFGSIPRALWWSVSSFTPLAGGVVPITTIGKVFAAISSLAGIGLVAMPTAILAAAFTEVFQARRR